MKNTLFLLPLAAIVILSGCMTQRNVQFPGRSYDAVFSGAVKGLCQDPELIVYDADKTNGIIRVQGRGLMVGPPDTALYVKSVGGTPELSLTMPGPNNPFAARFIDEASSQIPAAAVAPQAPAQDLDLEKQKLELEKQKLQLEKDKLELEKQKMQQQQQQK